MAPDVRSVGSMGAREPSRWDQIQANTDMPIAILDTVRKIADGYMKENPGTEFDDLEMLIDTWLDKQRGITADQWDTVAVSSTLEMVWEDNGGYEEPDEPEPV